MLRQLSMLLVACIVGLLAVAPVSAQDGPQVVNVYSSRHYGAMETVFNRFTEETGIEVRLSQGSAQSLLERLRAEGSQTPADVFFSIDAGALDLAASEGLLQPVESDVLTDALPDDLRDPDNQWFAISQRLRTIIYNTETVDPAELATYSDLADPQWEGRLCLRPATHIYTLALVGNLIHDLGEDGAQTVVEGWVANNPQYIDSDERIIDTLVAGGCDVAIVNHYYVARKLNADPTLPLGLIWANQGEDETGVHRNIFGAGVTAAALNRDNAVRLIEWMATDGQAGDETGVPGSNFEFPTNPAAQSAPQLEQFGVPVINAMPLSEYGDVQEAALNLLESAGYGF